MQKVRDFLNKIFHRKETIVDVECVDFYGNKVIAKSDNIAAIYSGDTILQHLLGCKKDFEEYIKANSKVLPKSVKDAFMYHEDLYPLSTHLALLGFYQSLLADDKKNEDKSIDLIVYKLMLDENDIVINLAEKAVANMQEACDYFSAIKPQYSGEPYEYIETVEIGLIFQLGALTEDLENAYSIYKLLDKDDNVVADYSRVDTIKEKVASIVEKQYLFDSEKENEQTNNAQPKVACM